MTTSVLENFMLDFEKRTVVAWKEKVLLLVDNFLGHKVPNLGA